MRYDRSRIRYGGSGLALAAALAWLVRYAGGLDTYYAPSDVSRWQHAHSWGGAIWFVYAGIGVASLMTAICLARALAPTRWRFALPLAPLIVVYTVAFGLAWYPLTGGH